MDEAWARTGYAAWNPYVADKPAKLHRVTPSGIRSDSWATSCGMLYSSRQVADPLPDDTRCGRCERKQ